jgi:putative peptidoglycan lipid II flippase
MQDTAFIGIAIATACGGYVNAALQWMWLTRKGIMSIDVPALRKQIGKMLMVSTAMAGSLIAIKLALPYNLDWPLLVRMLWLVVAMGIGGLVFVAGVQLTGLLDMKKMLIDLRNRRRDKALSTAVSDEL